MFNRRVRSVQSYTGDIIPPHILARMKKAKDIFDFLVIMTPYHDMVGKEWGDPNWARMVDPYVVGFKKGVPVMTLVGRFSDSGLFPEHCEMVADTINFLRLNVAKLLAFGSHGISFVWHPEERKNLGNALVEHGGNLLKAYESDMLFDWLRGKEVQPA